MKRISFKDSGGLHLTQAVMSGRKTMTRRAMSGQIEVDSVLSAIGRNRLKECIYVCEHSPYKFGDIVAIQQAYKDAHRESIGDFIFEKDYFKEQYQESAGWTNKMFVKAKYMPHHIRITDVRVERLQDISDEDCLREGVYKDVDGGRVIGYPFGVPFYYTFTGAISKDGKNLHWATPREAFASLIDKVSGRGTWNSNPLVWAYSFELVD